MRYEGSWATEPVWTLWIAENIFALLENRTTITQPLAWSLNQLRCPGEKGPTLKHWVLGVFLSYYNRYSTKMHFYGPTAVTLCSGLVYRAVRWDGTSFTEELNCDSLGVNADGLCCKWHYAAWGRGCLGDLLGLEPKVAESLMLAACTTGGVGGPRRCGRGCRPDCRVAEMHTAVRPTSFELMRTHEIT